MVYYLNKKKLASTFNQPLTKKYAVFLLLIWMIGRVYTHLNHKERGATSSSVAFLGSMVFCPALIRSTTSFLTMNIGSIIRIKRSDGYG